MSDETIGELQQIEDLIERLDARVPKDEAKVEMNLYGGGPDESQIRGTQSGYLRLGIELMRAAFAPKRNPKTSDTIDVDLDYLISDDSEVSFDFFERVDNFPIPPQRESLGSKVTSIVIAVFFIGLFVCAIIGICVIVAWAWKGLT